MGEGNQGGNQCSVGGNCSSLAAQGYCYRTTAITTAITITPGDARP